MLIPWGIVIGCPFTHGKKAWFMRHNADPYVRQARLMQFRSRAAFKLLEIEDKYHVLPKQGCVMDLGAAPGGWTQAIRQHSPKVTLVAIDLVQMDEVEGVHVICGDATSRTIQQQLLRQYNQFACIVSDMAPKFSESGETHSDIIHLNKDSLNCCFRVGGPSCHLVMKTLEGNYEKVMFMLLEVFFKNVRRFKPKSSKSQSKEHYFVCLGMDAEKRDRYRSEELLMSDSLMECRSKSELSALMDELYRK